MLGWGILGRMTPKKKVLVLSRNKGKNNPILEEILVFLFEKKSNAFVLMMAFIFLADKYKH